MNIRKIVLMMIAVLVVASLGAKRARTRTLVVRISPFVPISPFAVRSLAFSLLLLLV